MTVHFGTESGKQPLSPKLQLVDASKLTILGSNKCVARMDKRLIPLLLFGFFLIGVFINTFFQSKREFKKSYHFKIKKISVSPTFSLTLFDEADDRIELWNYSLRGRDGVKVGDSISKDSCAASLKILRMDSYGRYNVILSKMPDGLFGRNFFCK